MLGTAAPRFVAFLLVGLCLSGFLQPAHSQGGPPMFTESTGVLKAEQWEVNLAASTEPGDGARLYLSPLVDINYGITDRVSVSLTWPWLMRSPEAQAMQASPGRPEIGVKVLAVDRRVRVSTYPIVSTGVRTEGWVESRPAVYLPVQASTPVGAFTVSSEIAMQVVSDRDNLVAYGVTLGRPLSSNVALIVEARNESTASVTPETTLLNVGSTVAVDDHAALLASAGRVVHGTSPEVSSWLAFFGVQVTW